MYFLYILKSIGQNWHYIGSTGDVPQRLKKHNAGEVRSSKARRPLKLIHYETFPDRTAARKREIFLKKTAKARVELFAYIEEHAPIV